MTHLICRRLQSEYAPASQERRHYISGFTGSAGTALVTSDQALLWTDGRYYLQVGCHPRYTTWPRVTKPSLPATASAAASLVD